MGMCVRVCECHSLRRTEMRTRTFVNYYSKHVQITTTQLEIVNTTATVNNGGKSTTTTRTGRQCNVAIELEVLFL